MIAVIQRVKDCSVTVEGQVVGQINQGLCVLLGVAENDTEQEADWLLQKIVQMRIFGDAEGKMNLSLEDIKGEFMLISQFTLLANTKKGNRPSFIRAAKPDVATQLYEYTIQKAQANPQLSKVATGKFAADMKVSLCNDGPVTIIIDTENKQ
ncbi:MAG: D-aminoacyl-tRNA deacylase [Cytophagaceae bacterium]